MARIRTIKPEFWTSEQVVECSPIARLLFVGMWNFCDDYGNIPASVKSLKMKVLPGDDISLAEMDSMLEDLLRNGLIKRYSVDGKEYLHVTGWHHQRVDHPSKTRYPAPSQENSPPPDDPIEETENTGKTKSNGGARESSENAREDSGRKGKDRIGRDNISHHQGGLGISPAREAAAEPADDDDDFEFSEFRDGLRWMAERDAGAGRFLESLIVSHGRASVCRALLIAKQHEPRNARAYLTRILQNGFGPKGQAAPGGARRTGTDDDFFRGGI